jgi:hypothetical protein
MLSKNLLSGISFLIPIGVGIGVMNTRLEKVECDSRDIKNEQRILRERLFDMHEKVNEIYKNICNIK